MGRGKKKIGDRGKRRSEAKGIRSREIHRMKIVQSHNSVVSVLLVLSASLIAAAPASLMLLCLKLGSGKASSQSNASRVVRSTEQLCSRPAPAYPCKRRGIVCKIGNTRKFVEERAEQSS